MTTHKTRMVSDMLKRTHGGFSIHENDYKLHFSTYILFFMLPPLGFRKTLYWRIYRMRQPLLRGCSGLYEIADKNRFLGLTWRGSFPLLSNACHVTKDEKLADDLKYLERKVVFSIDTINF